MSAAPRMSFNGVWPTLLIKRRLPDFEQPTDALAAHILEQESRSKDATARYLEQGLLVQDHPALRWLKGQIDQTVAGFLRHAGIERPLTWKLPSWYNVNRYGDHHAAHTHPRSYLSGTYYVRVPAESASDDPHARPASISFYDPRTAANMVTAGSEPDARAAYVVHPGAGMLMMWPSPLQHSVHPNLSQEQRISISFNVIVGPGATAL
jgi:uncharacterized protein (TIGR02466 family)